MSEEEGERRCSPRGAGDEWATALEGVEQVVEKEQGRRPGVTLRVNPPRTFSAIK